MNTKIFKWFLIFLLISVSVFAFVGTTQMIKFDDKKSGMIIPDNGLYGCGVDGRIFFKFHPDNYITINKGIPLKYIDPSHPGIEKDFPGKFYRRNQISGIFEEVTTRLYSGDEYYFWSNNLAKDAGIYTIKIYKENIDLPLELKVQCPGYKYSCNNLKPVIERCYNTEDEKLVMEVSGIGLEEGDNLELKDLLIHTKGTNELIKEGDNVLAKDAKMERIGSEKYRITSSLLVGNPSKIETNIIQRVYLQPIACFIDLYSNAFTYKECEGVVKEPEKNEGIPKVTGGIIKIIEENNYPWVILLGGILFVLIGFFYIMRKRYDY